MKIRTKQHDTWYIYILYDPTFISKKFYIGYSYDPQHRFSSHINQKEENIFKDRWIEKLKNRNIIPSVFIFTSFSTEEQALEAEMQLIAFCKAISIKLLNMTGGGENPPINNGEDAHNAKLTFQQAEEIRYKYFNELHSQRNLAKEYNVTRRTIQNVIQYKYYINDNTIIPDNLETLLKIRTDAGIKKSCENRVGNKSHNHKLNNNDIIEIRKLFNTGNYTKSSLSKLFNITPTQTANIINKISWSHI